MRGMKVEGYFFGKVQSLLTCLLTKYISNNAKKKYTYDIAEKVNL